VSIPVPFQSKVGQLLLIIRRHLFGIQKLIPVDSGVAASGFSGWEVHGNAEAKVRRTGRSARMAGECVTDASGGAVVGVMT